MNVTFELPGSAYEAHTWYYESEHDPASHPPLTLSRPGAIAAPAGDGLPSSIKVNGYNYWRPGVGHPFRTPPPGDPTLSPLERWRTVWLPRVERHLAELAGFDPADVAAGDWRSILYALDDEYEAVEGGVHVGCLFEAYGAVAAFIAAYRAHFGSGREADGLALLHGFDNATSRRAGELWDLSRLVREDEGLRHELAAWQPGAPFPATLGFDAVFAAFLERWGQTLDRFVLDVPSWREDPSPLVRGIRTQATMDDGESPEARQQAAAGRRARLETELAEVAAADPAAGRALQRLPAAQQYLVVLEDHNVLSDQRLAASWRAHWLAIGRHLVGRGAIAAPGDVFYHRYDELVAVLEGGTPLGAAEVDHRRQLQAAYRAVTPPVYLGLPPAEIAGERGASASPELRGQGASRGVHRGRARIVNTLQQASALEPGEVLVCTITSPPWTPLFAIAGALVTEGGGPLSHPAVVAREFGIPAVVGCRGATTRIPQGAIVEVDGGAGTVRIIG